MEKKVWVNWHTATIVYEQPSSLECAHCPDSECAGWQGYYLQGPYVHWDPNRDQRAKCKCGHSYQRHFDSYDDMWPVGCKYCMCLVFEEP